MANLIGLAANEANEALARAYVGRTVPAEHIRNNGSVGGLSVITVTACWTTAQGHICWKVMKPGESFLRTYNLTSGGVRVAD